MPRSAASHRTEDTTKVKGVGGPSASRGTPSAPAYSGLETETARPTTRTPSARWARSSYSG